MMNKKFMSMFVAIVLSLVLLPAAALADKVVIENNTGSALAELYISNADTNSWEEDVLGRDVVAPGDSVRVDLGRNYMMYDFMAVFDNGAKQTYTNINVRQDKNIRLNADDADVW